mmetsp:Transcript_14460/g.16047  ORF Transcript_14460/g.16047 Transcript_14460/m.16047 type:complete len:103 (-) Transcript_14460:467-775(-)
MDGSVVRRRKNVEAEPKEEKETQDEMKSQIKDVKPKHKNAIGHVSDGKVILTPCGHLLRATLIVVLFAVLHYLFYTYVMPPHESKKIDPKEWAEQNRERYGF